MTSKQQTPNRIKTRYNKLNKHLQRLISGVGTLLAIGVAGLIITGVIFLGSHISPIVYVVIGAILGLTLISYLLGLFWHSTDHSYSDTW